MKKTKILTLLLMALLVLPISAFAEVDEDGLEIVAEDTKYYKTVTVHRNDNSSAAINMPTSTSITTEVTEEEYNSVVGTEAIITRDYSTTIETTYKSMTSTITQNGSYFRYKNVLNWKLMPATRGFDIMGIGIMSTVKPVNGSIYFNQEWSYTSGGGNSSGLGVSQTFSNGVGYAFPLPNVSINSLKETLYFDVEKNTPYTIIFQHAYGDYSHETDSSLSPLLLNNYYVSQSMGIVLDPSISGYFDEIQAADAYWTGSW